MKKYIALLVFLISSLTITGISFIDGKIWDTVLLIVGFLAYCAVGLLYSIRFIGGKEAGKEAYAIFFTIFLIGAYAVYARIQKLHAWILSWHIAWKIIVPIILLLVIGFIVYLMIKHWSDDDEYN